MSLSTLGACEEGCEGVEITSTGLAIVDAESGDPVPDVILTYQLDGGAMYMPYDMGDSHFALGDEPGVYSVSIEAPGYEPMQTEYVLTQDEHECPVTPIADTIELVPLP